MVNRIRQAFDQRDQGFTLIELLVVILIIGVLAAIAIPVFLNQRKKGVDASMKSDLKNAATTAETISVDQPTLADFTSGQLTGAGFKVTTGNIVRVSGGPAAGYCVGVENANSTFGSGQWIQYDSTAGGIIPGSRSTGTNACTVYGNPAWVAA